MEKHRQRAAQIAAKMVVREEGNRAKMSVCVQEGEIKRG
jgi:hypothetical protein